MAALFTFAPILFSIFYCFAYVTGFICIGTKNSKINEKNQTIKLSMMKVNNKFPFIYGNRIVRREVLLLRSLKYIMLTHKHAYTSHRYVLDISICCFFNFIVLNWYLSNKYHAICDLSKYLDTLNRRVKIQTKYKLLIKDSKCYFIEII